MYTFYRQYNSLLNITSSNYQDVKHLHRGFSSEVIKANWKAENIVVVLKTVVDLDETDSDNQKSIKNNQEFSKEIKPFHEIKQALLNKEKTPPIGEEWQQPIELQQNEFSESDNDVTYDENLIQTELPQILISETEYRENMHDNLVDKNQLDGQRKSELQGERENEQLKNECDEQRGNYDEQMEDERNDKRVFNKVLEKVEQLSLKMFNHFSPKELEVIERLPNNKVDEIVNLVQSVAHRKKKEKM
ncbi:3252_t:CDS:2 [Cetraspora pellucida]|uniref:3252_t:CDS:1 n=1 Tax=Cetraspora pellucida TaxID=1433469 RepID=A0A9N9IEG1_9GLOM|nr:3252_t:CDS:2 [Cetraspora pellucida]